MVRGWHRRIRVMSGQRLPWSTLRCSAVAYTSRMSTPHISAGRDEFSDVCLLPGDPLRARYVAKQFLDDAELVT